MASNLFEANMASRKENNIMRKENGCRPDTLSRPSLVYVLPLRIGSKVTVKLRQRGIVSQLLPEKVCSAKCQKLTVIELGQKFNSS